MSLADEIKVSQMPDYRIASETYGRHNNKQHDEIAEQMREFEKHNTVQIIPMGASAEYNPLRMDSIARGSKSGASTIKTNAIKPMTMFPDNKTKRNKAKKKDGNQNLYINDNGKCTVIVGSITLGTFEKDEALKVRDNFRAKNGLPPAEY
jgi:hypothetical protein